jgi:hypothetical protein
MPGTTGWDSTFSGRPTMLWNPVLQENPGFGVGTNGFSFNVTGTSGIPLIIEAAEDLANPIWSPLFTNRLTDVPLHFTDALWTNYPSRLYRARPPLEEVVAPIFTYITTNNAITITGCTGPAGDLIIPSSISRLPVTTIGDYAFANYTSLDNITIPETVISIGFAAFAGCTSLTNITIPKSVVSIGTFAFDSGSQLTTIVVDAENPKYSSREGVLFDKTQATLLRCPEGKAETYIVPPTVITIGQNAFRSCSLLTNVTIPYGVSSIKDQAFDSCAGLKTLTIPGSVTNIERYAFGFCAQLSQALLGNGIITLGDSAFSQCTNLAELSLPNTIRSIGSDAFWGCRQLTNVVLPEGLSELQSGVFLNCANLTNVVIHNGVTNIGVIAFGGCSSLTNVTIPASVTNLATQAFYYCTGLTGVFCEGNAPGFGSSVFEGDNNAIVYYLPGTTGWGATFADRPTALWNPQADVRDANFGVRSNHFGFNITETANIPLVVEASTNFDSPTWVTLQTCTLTNGLIYFSDADSTNYAERFYRIRSP